MRVYCVHHIRKGVCMMIRDLLREAQQHLAAAMFESLSVCLASEAPVKPKAKQFTYQNGRFKIIDSSRPSFMTLHQLRGMTSIWCNDRLIWVMQYAEDYSDEDRPLIRRILRMSHREILRTGEFFGVRGPWQRVLPSQSLVYRNVVHEHSDFGQFSGHESLRSSDSPLERGRCDYWGSALI